MNLVGGVVGLVVVLLLAGPLLGLFVVLQPELTDGQRAVGVVAERALVSFLIIYTYGVVSSYLFALVMRVVGFVPGALLRRIVTWLLAVAYLVGLFFFLTLGFPLLLGGYLTAAFVGSFFVEAGALGALWLLLHFAIPFQFLFVVLAYVLADAFAPPPAGTATAGTPASLAWRGAMVGVNAGLNFLVGTVVVGGVVEAFLGVGAIVAGVSVGLAFAVITFVSAGMPTPSIGANAAVRAFVGWTSWLLPTSWFTVSVGWITYLLNLVFHVFLSVRFHPWASYFQVVSGTLNFPTGTMFLEGGIAGNSWVTGGGPLGARGAYDLGPFVNVHSNTVPIATLIPGLSGVAVGGTAMTIYLIQHESGHNLNLNAMGTFFHFANLVDQSIFPARGGNAYAERLADSCALAAVRPAGRSTLLFWRNA